MNTLSKISPLHQRILSIAWPMILSGISTPLLGLIDAAILGHLNSSIYMGSVAVGAVVLSLVFWGFAFLRMGTTGLSAQAFGQNNQIALANLLGQTLILGLILGTTLLVSQPLISALVLPFIQPSPEVLSLAENYIQIRFLSAPATLLSFALIGWCIGQQNSRIPMVIIISCNLLNIVFDFIFIISFEMNSAGAAWATVCAEWISLFVGLFFVTRKYTPIIKLIEVNTLKRFSNYKKLIQVNTDLFLRTLCLLFTFAFFVSQGAQQGDDTLAANMLLMNLILVTAYGMDGFAHAAEALVGEAIGAKNILLFKQSCRGCFQFGIISGVLFAVLFFSAEDLLLRSLTSLPEVILIAKVHYLWIVFMPLIALWAYILDGIFIGATDTRTMRNTMFASVVLVYLPTWYFSQSLGNHGLWLAFFVFNIARDVLLAGIFIYKNKHQLWI